MCEQLFEAMGNVVIPMVGLLSFREILSHMTGALKIAQKFGMTLRIAQYLKYFCYIDLLRLHAENCETRLQDLEHILSLEDFQKSMNSKIVQRLDSQVSHIHNTNRRSLAKSFFLLDSFPTCKSTTIPRTW